MYYDGMKMKVPTKKNKDGKRLPFIMDAKFRALAKRIKRDMEGRDWIYEGV